MELDTLINDQLWVSVVRATEAPRLVKVVAVTEDHVVVQNVTTKRTTRMRRASLHANYRRKT